MVRWPLVLATCLLWLMAVCGVGGAESYGWDAQNMYSEYTTEGRHCALGPRPGINYAEQVVGGFPYWYDAVFEARDLEAWEAHLTTSSSAWVEACDFFIWAGHGYSSGRGPHFFNKNSDLVHDSETQDEANAGWSEIRWGGVNWATMYTCNFFYPKSSMADMFPMCEGIHFFVGFNQTMYMDSDEGSYYGWLICDPISPVAISTAFNEAARAYQPANGSSVTRTVTLGATATFSDTIYSYAGDPVKYTSNPAAYQYVETPVS